MISSIRGVVERKGEDFLIVQVGGVGLKVFVPTHLLEECHGAGEEIRLFTHLYLKENDIALYGFAEEEELNLFEMLLSVPGVGPKAAVALLSYLSPATLQAAIAQEKCELLTRVPGVGPKMARNIIFHLKDKVETAAVPAAISVITKADEEVIAALTSLGYSLVEAQRAVQSVPKDVTDVEERLRLALSYFASQR